MKIKLIEKIDIDGFMFGRPYIPVLYGAYYKDRVAIAKSRSEVIEKIFNETEPT